MSHRVTVSRLAKAEVQVAEAWYDTQQEGVGARFLEAFEKSALAIGEGPERWPIFCKSVRRYVMTRFPYVIYFQVKADGVGILRVVHAARDPLPIRDLLPDN